VTEAMRAHPAWVSGTQSDGRKLMEAVPGLVHKVGAEAVDAFALPDGSAAAVKLDDGANRARTPVTAATIRRLGTKVPGEFTTALVTGGDEIVGVIRATAF
jgi:L-asparaginase II